MLDNQKQNNPLLLPNADAVNVMYADCLLLLSLDAGTCHAFPLFTSTCLSLSLPLLLTLTLSMTSGVRHHLLLFWFLGDGAQGPRPLLTRLQ